MATVLPMRPNTNSTGTSSTTTSRTRDPSLSSFPSSKGSGSQSTANGSSLSAHHHTSSTASNQSSAHSYRSSPPGSLQLPTHSQHHHPNSSRRFTASTAKPNRAHTARPQPVRSQYPASSTEKHVEYILVASFDIDRGSVMEHQYPGPVGGDEHMLAELMLPDQTHLRSQDWTIFFLHKDGGGDEDVEEGRRNRRKRRRKGGERQAGGGAEAGVGEDEEGGGRGTDDEDGDDEGSEEDEEESEDDDDNIDGPPLVYVLNLVNTKQDNTVKRGAVVKAMAVCTRHSFLHIYKPLLLLALEQYFANPVIETLAELYDAVNAMDLSLMPRLTTFEKFILQTSDAKDLFIEKFEAIIAQRMAATANHAESQGLPAPSPTTQPLHSAGGNRSRYGLPRDTHEFESVVKYANIPIPIKVPTALSPETVGDFSLVKLITTFSTPHNTNPIPFTPTHPHLTTNGSTTHPIIVLLNALLTQKRIIFLGHNLPSSEVAEAVLGACALASGGILRGFTRHAFPYTDLTKIDDLLKVPGFIAGVTNPAFGNKSEWWDLLCDLGTGRMRISSKIEPAGLTEGVRFFQTPGNGGGQVLAHHGGPHGSGGPGVSAIAAAGASLSAGLGGSAALSGSLGGGGGDATGDVAFMAHVLKAIEERQGENAVRVKFRKWVVRFTRLAAAFEEMVYGASALQITGGSPKTASSPFAGAGQDPSNSPASTSSPFGATGRSGGTEELPPEVTGHGYVWPTPYSKTHELAANATRIEGWRNTRSYYNLIQDLATYYPRRPVQHLDLQHLHDKLTTLRLNAESSGKIYMAICQVVRTEGEISQLLAVIVNGVQSFGPTSGVAGGGGGVGGGSDGGIGGQQGQGMLFYLALGLFHGRVEVREAVAELLGRVREHEAGRHFWRGVGRFGRVGWERVMAAREARLGVGVSGEGDGG